jgi:hypothetical protein
MSGNTSDKVRAAIVTWQIQIADSFETELRGTELILVSTHAIAICWDDGSLALFLRVGSSPSVIYVVVAAGQERAGHDPHSSWHRDGRVHHKSFKREFRGSQKRALDSFTDDIVEQFITTSTNRGDAPYLPESAKG